MRLKNSNHFDITFFRYLHCYIRIFWQHNKTELDLKIWLQYKLILYNYYFRRMISISAREKNLSTTDRGFRKENEKHTIRFQKHPNSIV